MSWRVENTTYAGLVIRSSAVRMRYTLDFERKCRSHWTSTMLGPHAGEPHNEPMGCSSQLRSRFPKNGKTLRVVK